MYREQSFALDQDGNQQRWFKTLFSSDLASYLSLCVRKPKFGFQTRSDTIWAVQSQKKIRSLKFRIYGEKELYYLCSENKDADQLSSYCAADLRLCFHR